MKNNKQWVKDIYIKYNDIILYLFFGICTTIINFLVYCILSEMNIFSREIKTVVNTWIAWFISVIFAYVTNRKWVFKSHAKGFKNILKEITLFFSCRVATGILDVIIMFLFVDNLHTNNKITKLVSNVVIIILNYVGSKVLIFKKK